MRKFYALFNYYGVATLGGANDIFLAFNSAEARNEYLTTHEWREGNLVCKVCTRRDVISALGKKFVILYPAVYPEDGEKEIGRCYRKNRYGKILYNR